MKIKAEDLTDLSKPDGGKFKVNSLNEAQEFCRKLAAGHYENFPVGSVIIDRNLRPDYFSVYAFSRTADDIADELTHLDKTELISVLDNYRDLLYNEDFDSSESGNPIFIALRHTTEKHDIPAAVLEKLLTAFKRDINFSQARNLDDHLDYCNYSANPVGELVLRIHGAYNSKTAPLSDKICSGLQLVNFWQDLSRDIKIGRHFIPNDLMSKFELTKENLFDENNSAKLKLCLNELYDYTESLFEEGRELIPHLPGFRLKKEIAVTIKGGMRILNKSRSLGSEIIYRRPKLNGIDIASILFRAFF
ncbi:MAG: squalene/phytoene synthase family protein [Candidatus Kapabacteria bacterium]|jgi:squalene synthase HpnC|nr:squalene/phytoene synthase family protein [Candidatus Kapabacteria bacterium]